MISPCFGALIDGCPASNITLAIKILVVTLLVAAASLGSAAIMSSFVLLLVIVFTIEDPTTPEGSFF